MSSGGKSDNRGNRRRHFRRHEREKNPSVPQDARGRKADASREGEAKNDKNRESAVERLRWIPPKLSTEPLPAPDCPYCGKPIKDLSLAISDKDSGEAVHFDCIITRLNQGENLEPGDTISYIGGGRFGVVRFGSNSQGFTIKKIFEWENKENRAEWRQTVSDHFSVT
jgi:hypothetical protein